MLPNQLPSLNFDLGETADMLRDTVMSFASEEIAPLAAEIDRDDRFPRALWPSSPSLGQRPRGKASSRSISAASGAISSEAKLITVSRSMSAVSPRPKLSEGSWLGSMSELLR